MKIINKVVVAQLKNNIKRSIVTIFGIAIAVAMLTSVAACFQAAITLAKNYASYYNGTWNAYYEEVPVSQIPNFTNVEGLKNYGVVNSEGKINIKSTTDTNNYLETMDCTCASISKNGLSIMPYRLSTGNWPENDNEIVLSDSCGDYKIGDIINVTYVKEDEQQTNKSTQLNESQNKKDFIITGLFDTSGLKIPKYKAITYLNENSLKPNDLVDIYLSFENISWKQYKELYDKCPKKFEQNFLLNIGSGFLSSDFLHDLSAENIKYITNIDPLFLKMFTIILSFSKFLFIVVIIAAVIMIYSAFSISLSERSKYLGILSSVGATGNQKFKSVFFEAFALGGFGIILGLVVGFVGIGTTFYLTKNLWINLFDAPIYLKLKVSNEIIVGIIALSIITIAISALIPAIKSARKSIMSVIKQTNEVKLTRKEVKTSKIVQKLFGIEGELGLKNLKRNKSKCRITIFSLTSCIIVLLLTCAYLKPFLNYADFLNTKTKKNDINLYIDIYNMGTFYIENNNDNLIDNIKKTKNKLLAEHSNFEAIDEEAQYILLDKSNKYSSEDLSKRLNEMHRDFKALPNEKSFICKLCVKPKKDFKEFVDNIGKNYQQNLNIQDFENETRPVFLLHGNQTSESFKIPGVKIISLANKTSPDNSIDSFYCTEENFEKFLKLNSNTKLLLEKCDIGFNFDKSYKEFQQHKIFKAFSKLESSVTNSEQFYFHLTDNQEYKIKMRALAILISTFIIGFLILLLFICIANIFNTLSTNVILRKKEFAALKSIGFEEKNINKVLSYETFFYTTKVLVYSIPISIALIVYITRSFYSIKLSLLEVVIPWKVMIATMIVVFIVIKISINYAKNRIKKENIMDAIKQENI